jgi:hypothetical protein
MKQILIILLSLSLISCARQAKFYDGLGISKEKDLKIEKAENSIQVGEKLIYAVDWIGIPAGFIIIEVKETLPINGEYSYHVIAKATPNKFFKLFHNVEYTVHSYTNVTSKKNVKFRKERLLNNALTEEELSFDYTKNQITWTYSNPKKEKVIPIPENNQDLLSALYSFRTNEIKIKETYKINIVYGCRAWPVNIVLADTRDIRIPGVGDFKVAIVNLFSELNSYITGFNNIQIYLSLDKRRLPVLFRMRTKIGYLSGVLSSYK